MDTDSIFSSTNPGNEADPTPVISDPTPVLNPVDATPSGTLGQVIAVGTIVNSTSFVINSLSSANTVVTTDNSVINWLIIN